MVDARSELTAKFGLNNGAQYYMGVYHSPLRMQQMG